MVALWEIRILIKEYYLELKYLILKHLGYFKGEYT